MRSKLRNTAALIVGLLALPSSAHAERTRVAARLVYVREDGAEACPDEQVVRDLVAARLGYDPFRVEAVDTLTLTIAREAKSFRGKLALVRGANAEASRRSLESSSCEDLVATASLTASVALDPLSATGAPPPPPEPPPPSPPPAASSSPAANPPLEAPRPVPPPPRNVSLLADLGGYAAVGAGPATTFGGALALGLRIRPLRFGIEGRAELPGERDSNIKGRVRGSATSAFALGCGELVLDPIGVFGCAEGGLAFLSATSLDVAEPRESDAVVPTLGGKIGVFKAFGDFELRAYGELLARLRSVRLEQDERVAFVYPGAYGTVGISAGVRLW